MTIEEIQTIIDNYLSEHGEGSGFILVGEGDKGLTYGCGTKGDLTNLIYQMLLQDEQGVIVECFDSAFQKFMEWKKAQVSAQKISTFSLFKTNNKIKS